jgi:peptidyl-tRNA hydrolase
MDLVIVFIVLCIIAWLRKPLASLSRLHGQTRAAVAAALAAIGTAAFRAWRRDGQPQVVLRVAGLDDLLAIADQASAAGPPVRA